MPDKSSSGGMRVDTNGSVILPTSQGITFGLLLPKQTIPYPGPVDYDVHYVNSEQELTISDTIELGHIWLGGPNFLGGDLQFVLPALPALGGSALLYYVRHIDDQYYLRVAATGGANWPLDGAAGDDTVLILYPVGSGRLNAAMIMGINEVDVSGWFVMTGFDDPGEGGMVYTEDSLGLDASHDHKTILFNTDAVPADLTCNLPVLADHDGMVVTIKNMGVSEEKHVRVTPDGGAGDRIDGYGVGLPVQLEDFTTQGLNAITLLADASRARWHIVSDHWVA